MIRDFFKGHKSTDLITCDAVVNNRKPPRKVTLVTYLVQPPALTFRTSRTCRKKHVTSHLYDTRSRKVVTDWSSDNKPKFPSEMYMLKAAYAFNSLRFCSRVNLLEIHCTAWNYHNYLLWDILQDDY